MSEIAVVHPNLQMKGGAEDVCLQVIEALQTDYDITLFTLIPPNMDALNQYFNAKVQELPICTPPHPIIKFSQWAGNRAVKLQSGLLSRLIRRNCYRFDLIISTKNELAFDTVSVEYIHHPQYSVDDPGLSGGSLARQAYDILCRQLAAVNSINLQSSVLLANSNWTAKAFDDAYGIRPKTVYPPVHTARFTPTSWENRENGFLTIGRVGPSKRILENIEVISRLRERGHDVHLHIVGPTTDGEYCEQVKRRSTELEYIHFEGAVDYEIMTDLITEHKYGLHGRPYEHFGIVVAELAAGGAIPFVPDSGGQREILQRNSALLYDSVDDAVEKIDAVLSNPALAADLREDLSSSADRFGRERFKETIREIVTKTLS
jgi:glycosyltransferase involved in cell wall biosynthesis